MVPAPEKPGREVRTREPRVGTPVGQERPLAVRLDQDDAEPGGELGVDRGMDVDPSRRERLDGLPAGGVVADPDDERGRVAGVGEPGGDVRAAPTTVQPHLRGGVRAAGQRAVGPGDDVDHEIADHHDSAAHPGSTEPLGGFAP